MRRTFFVFLILFIASCKMAYADTLRVYPFPAGLTPAKDFIVKINGKEVFVYDSPVGALVHFESSKTVQVEIISLALDIKRIDIRPKRHHVNFGLGQGRITIDVPRSVNLSVEFNGNISRPLFIVSNLPDQNKPDPTARNVHYFKAGKIYQIGPQELKDNEEVYIEGGAIVRGSFKASNAKNVIIRGHGIIDGINVRGEEEYRVAVKNYRHWRKLVHFLNCRNAKIENVVLLNSNTWNIVPDNSDNVVIDNVKIICGNPSDDGIDILQSSNVTIKNCFIRSKDDCIAIKSLFETTPDKITKGIVVENCVLWSAEWGNAMEIGFETLSASIEDVVFRNCDVIHEEGGAVFSIHNADYATVRNIRYENIVVEDARDKLIDFAIFVSLFSKDNPYDIDEFKKDHYLKGTWSNVMKIPEDKLAGFAAQRGQIENIILNNIKVEGLFPYSIINGFDDQHRINKVLIKDLYVNGKKIINAEDGKVFQRYVTGVEFK